MKAVIAVLLGLWSVTALADFEMRKAEHEIAGTLLRETVWSLDVAPFGEYDRIQVHRYRTDVPARGAVLHLPGTNMSGELGPMDEAHNFWIYLANRGIEVYVLDYRTHAVPPGGITDFSFMKEWTVDRFVDDARQAAAFALRTSGQKRLVVSGFSRGVSFAYGLISVAPSGSVAGLISLDGSFKSCHEKPVTDYDASLQKLAASKRFASDVAGGRGWAGRHQLMQRACSDPSAPPINDRYETIGAELTESLYNAWGPGRLANAKEGISRPAPLGCLLDTYDRYWPTVQNLEGRAISSQKNDPRTTIDDLWGSFKLPIIHFSSTGMGAEMIMSGIYSAAESGSRDVELHLLERYGHLDVLVGENAQEDVFEPLMTWLDRVLQ